MRLGCIPGILKQSGSQPNGEALMSLVQRKVRRKQWSLKVMHMIFFDMNGVILRWPVPIGTTINAHTTRRCCMTNSDLPFERNDPGCWSQASCFTTTMRQFIQPGQYFRFLAGYKWELLEHPRYSPDLAPVIFTYSLK
ncbi:hypothetical protein RRG08_057115 [Elysia crispata]|uniref:Uncharacterized protein n=1 Tax=Elysia crispata TaxID=231223 RepID=A0AAE0Z6F8_9GAST|nr:hypothetical protein RRG08_057115 [Elysia crispata]